MRLFSRRPARDESGIDTAAAAGADHNLAPDQPGMEIDRVYWLVYESRDIGYGVEADAGEFIYRGGPDWTGKHEFQPVGGGETAYLFPDEITEAWQ